MTTPINIFKRALVLGIEEDLYVENTPRIQQEPEYRVPISYFIGTPYRKDATKKPTHYHE